MVQTCAIKKVTAIKGVSSGSAEFAHNKRQGRQSVSACAQVSLSGRDSARCGLRSIFNPTNQQSSFLGGRQAIVNDRLAA